MKNSKIPDLYLEQALLDELPDDKKQILERDETANRLESLRKSDEEILRTYNPADVAAEIQGRLEAGQSEEVPADKTVIPGWFGQHRTTIVLAAAALAVLAGISPYLFRENPAVNTSPAGTEITRIKGMTPEILVYRKSDGTVEQLRDQMGASENDLLQISYNAAGKRFGIIFSIDGRGIVTLHYPTVRDGSLVLKRDGEVALEYSYRLDDAPRFERFFFVTSDTTFNIDLVLSAAGSLAERLAHGSTDGALDLPDGFDHASLTVKKEGSK